MFVGNKRENKEMKKNMQYNILPYPKNRFDIAKDRLNNA